MLNSHRLNITLLILLIFNLEYVASKCNKEPYGVYCTNISENQTHVILDFENEKNDTVTTIFLRNITGRVTNDTFKSYPKLEHLEIQFSNITNFTANLPSIKELYLVNNQAFPNLTEQYFQNCCQNLTNLIIQDNYKLNLTEGSFKYLKKLNHLTIRGQNITHLQKKYLEGPSNLDYLDLNKNNIKTIDNQAFEDLKFLNYLILNNNNITIFEPNTFKNLTNLQYLDLTGLNMTSISKNLFKNQKELRYIGLPTKCIQQNITISNLTNIFSNLETIKIQSADQNDSSVLNFIETCKYSGFNIIFE